MHGAIRTHRATSAVIPNLIPLRHNAAVWIEPGRAVVVRELDGGGIDTLEIGIPPHPAAVPPAMAAVARHIGAAYRVLVMGPDDLRTALEREIVAIGHHPEILLEIAAEGPASRDILIGQLRLLV